MITPAFLSFLGGVAFFFLYLGLIRPAGLLDEQRKESLLEDLDTRLKRAGLTRVTPASIIFLAGMSCGVVFLAVLFAFKVIIFAALAAAAFPFMIVLYLDYRARKYQEKLTAVLVPFLRKITAQVRTGTNPTRAFAIAAKEEPLLAYTLREQLANLQMQQPFIEVLRESVKVMPLRPWVQFVRSMEAFSKSGGELAEILEANVNRIQSQILLRKKLMGDVATYRGQQIVILLFAVGIPFLLVLMSGELFGSIISHPVGIIALIIAAAIDGFAMWITNRAIRDVESKMEA